MGEVSGMGKFEILDEDHGVTITSADEKPKSGRAARETAAAGVAPPVANYLADKTVLAKG